MRLTSAQIDWIVTLWKLPEAFTVRDIARITGIHVSTITSVLRRKNRGTEREILT